MAEIAHAPDDLLAQLNGELPPLLDPAPDAAPSRASELEVKAPAPLSPAAKADAAHATKAGGKGWKVVVKGEYFAENPAGRGKIAKPYSAEFMLPHLYDGAALSVIKNKLLEPKLRKMHSDFIAVRTNKIASATPLSPETPLSNNIQFMNREQLVAHVGHIRAPIVCSAYRDDADLRDALIDFIQTPDGFEKREAERLKAKSIDAELAALNTDIEVES